jgi:hypothetical protein
MVRIADPRRDFIRRNLAAAGGLAGTGIGRWERSTSVRSVIEFGPTIESEISYVTTGLLRPASRSVECSFSFPDFEA